MINEIMHVYSKQLHVLLGFMASASSILQAHSDVLMYLQTSNSGVNFVKLVRVRESPAE